jgi:hypothetical protein
MRLIILKIINKILLPKDVWVGKHKSPYQSKYTIIFGKLDNRGVLQGIEDEKVFLKPQQN